MLLRRALALERLETQHVTGSGRDAKADDSNLCDLENKLCTKPWKQHAKPHSANNTTKMRCAAMLLCWTCARTRDCCGARRAWPARKPL
eukprot:4973574-Pyramimonas_sp.AAC.1